MIYVFLSGAVISCDASVPLFVEFARRYPNEKVVFVVFAQRTLGDIEKNVVLFDTANKLGGLRSLTTQRLKGWPKLRNRTRRWVFLAMALFRGVTGRATYLHFGDLNRYPLRLLFLANRRNTFVMQASPLGNSRTEQEIDRVRYPELKVKKDIAAGVLIAQNHDWPALSYPNLANVPRYVVSPPSTRKAWHEYLREISPSYLSSIGISEKEPLAVFILSSLDPPNLTYHEDEFIALFEQCLDVMADEVQDLPVIIKRHPKTTPQYLQRIDDVVCRTRKSRCVVADLHPMLLAARARFFISNWTSTTYFNASTFNVPIIEYVHYAPEVLAITGNRSPRPELVTHFINFDEIRLREAIRDVMAKPAPAPTLEYPHDADYETVLRLLARERDTTVGAARP